MPGTKSPTKEDSSVPWPPQSRGDFKMQNQCSSSHGDNNKLKNKKAAQRTVFTPQQLYYLEERFVENQFPDADQRERIASHLNLTPHHVQVWFQNKRAKTRRKSKKREIEKSKVHVPKPPSFWPQHLPFDSNFTEILHKPVIANHDSATTTSSSSITKHECSDLSMTKLCSSVAQATSTTSLSTLSHLESANTVHDFPFIQRSNAQLSCDTGPRISISPHNHYLASFSSFHSNLYANGKSSLTAKGSVTHVSDQNVGGEKMQPSSLFKTNHPSSSCTNTDHDRTTESSHAASTNYGYLDVNSATFNYSRANQTHGDNASLLLLANCATFTAADHEDSMQSRPPTSMSEQSISSTTCTLSNGTQLPYSPSACEYEATHYFPSAIHTCSPIWYSHGQYLYSVKEESQQYRQPITEPHNFSRGEPRKQLSLITEKEMQNSCLTYPVEKIQVAPLRLFSEEPFPLQDILDNQMQLQESDSCRSLTPYTNQKYISNH